MTINKRLFYLLCHAILFVGVIAGINGYLTFDANNSSMIAPYDPRDYQIEITEDSLSLYDADRLVGTVPFDHICNGITPIDSLIILDNQ